eukprot:EG_transcript_4032
MPAPPRQSCQSCWPGPTAGGGARALRWCGVAGVLLAAVWLVSPGPPPLPRLLRSDLSAASSRTHRSAAHTLPAHNHRATTVTTGSLASPSTSTSSPPALSSSAFSSPLPLALSLWAALGFSVVWAICALFSGQHRYFAMFATAGPEKEQASDWTNLPTAQLQAALRGLKMNASGDRDRLIRRLRKVEADALASPREFISLLIGSTQRPMKRKRYREYLEELEMLCGAALQLKDTALADTILTLRCELESDFGDFDTFSASPELIAGDLPLLSAVHRSAREAPPDTWVQRLLEAVAGGSRVERVNSAIALRGMLCLLGPEHHEEGVAEGGPAPDVVRSHRMLSLYKFGLDVLTPPPRVEAPFLGAGAGLELDCPLLEVAAASATVALFAIAKDLLPRGTVTLDEAIPLLGACLASPKYAPRSAAALLIAGLADTNGIARALHKAGTVAPLVTMLLKDAKHLESFRLPAQPDASEADMEEGRIRALYALCRLATVRINRAAMVGEAMEHILIHVLQTAATPNTGALVARLYLALTESQEPEVRAVVLRAVDPLVELLASETGSLAAAAALCLGVLANEEEDQMLIAAAGAIQPLVGLLASDDSAVHCAAAGALQCLAEHDANKRTIVAAGALPRLARLLRSGEPAAQRAAALAVVGLVAAAGDDAAMAEAGIIDPLVALLEVEDRKMGQAAVAALMHCCGADPANLPFFVAAGGVAPIVDMLLGPDDAHLCVLLLLEQLGRHPQYRAVAIDAGVVEALQTVARLST